MIRKSWPMIAAVVLASMMVLAGQRASAQGPRLPPGAETSYDIEETQVLKVFSAEDQGHRFVAYLVKWKDSEVIVGDPLARSAFAVGDTIKFMVNRMKLPNPTGNVSSLRFMLLNSPSPKGGGPVPAIKAPPPAEQKRTMRLVQGDLSAATNETERFYALGKAAKKALKAGKTEDARKLATELEGLAPKHKNDWNYGNAIQDANQVLGRIALAEGDVEEAKKRLLASADSKGSPQMNSFGPNMQLAEDLLAKGEKDVVLIYFERCATFWRMGADRIATWTKAVNEGQTPQFGANLDY
ncbi:MAG: hypothetical protein HN742_34415 [Lentisphaerae bacterium]|nr:hypothetical protein [Lentisphaerota bacterium]MBT4816417.1 hypothetical protein [Lentisphaerota bacterium]MBT5605053.1 hypothetical protein [Lentisphaerota bacterium]MBT7058675.1 hypothetical protein [Lentisphaerota bacterium]MBT7847016.1 hypothetical protein [Lentisphaerota bacterium]